jgi:tRNA pseudouridine38-40 synthase
LPTTEDAAAAAPPPPQRRVFRLVIEYDGTDFAGFQLQGKGERTVQGELEAAIRRLSGETARVHGAGRTDAGVHALGQVVHFRSAWLIPPEKLARALNGRLPPDLVVRAASEAREPGFHARFSATARVYRYVFLNRAAPSALVGRYSWHVADGSMCGDGGGGEVLAGTHDFAAFGQPQGRTKARCAVERLEVRPGKTAF